MEATHCYAAAFKPNSAFFEAFGPPGIEALIEVVLSFSLCLLCAAAITDSSCTVAREPYPPAGGARGAGRQEGGYRIHCQSVCAGIVQIIHSCGRSSHMLSCVFTLPFRHHQAAYDIAHANAVTLSPYMGYDSVQVQMTLVVLSPLLDCVSYSRTSRRTRQPFSTGPYSDKVSPRCCAVRPYCTVTSSPRML